MRPKEYDIDPDDVDTNLIAESQTTTTAGGNLTLATTSLDYARQIGITSAGNDTGLTFTVVGTDPDGYTQTEDITGVSATVAESTKYYKVISSIAVDGATTTGGVIVGTVDELVTQTIPLDWRSDVAANLNVDVTGTINFTVQETFDDIQRPGLSAQSAAQNAQWINITALTSKTADTNSVATVGAHGVRLVVNSYTNGAEIQLNVNQPTSRVGS